MDAEKHHQNMDDVSKASSDFSRKKGKAVMSRESLLSLSTPKSQATVLEDISKCVHRNVAGNFAIVEEAAFKNVDRIHSMLAAAGELSPRRFTTEAFSNHISRLQLEPIQSGRIKKKPPLYKYERVTLPVHREIEHPDWNGRFVYADLLDTSKANSKKGKITTSVAPVLDRYIGEFRGNAPKEPELNTSSLKHGTWTRENLIATYLFQKPPKRKHTAMVKLKPLDALEREKYRAEHYSPSQRELNTRKNVISRYKYAWEGLIAEFNDQSAKAISYKFLVNLGNLTNPPSQIIPVIGYVCLLLGIEATWPAAKKYLFHDVNSFHRFICHINPLTIQLPHLQAAMAYFVEQKLDTCKKEAQHVYRPIICLLDWIYQLQYFVRAILNVYTWRCESVGVSNVATIPCPIVDMENQEDLDEFYFDIKHIDNVESEFWDRFEKYLPLRFIEEIVDDEAGNVIEDNDTFDDVDLTEEAAFDDVLEAEKHVEKAPVQNKFAVRSNYQNRKRDNFRSMRMKKGISSRVLNTLSLDNLKTIALDGPPAPMVSSVSKRLYDITSISQIRDAQDIGSLKIDKASRNSGNRNKSRKEAASTRSVDSNSSIRQGSDTNDDVSSVCSEDGLNTSEDVDDDLPESLPGVSASLGCVMECVAHDIASSVCSDDELKPSGNVDEDLPESLPGVSASLGCAMECIGHLLLLDE